MSPAGREPSTFSLTAEVADGTATVRLLGELDGTSAPDLQSAALGALSDGASSLVLDCSELTFVDSAGLNVFLEAYRSADAQDGSVKIVHPSETLLRLLQVTGLTEHFGITSAE
jgi:anti-sigma B factor antagonist